MAVFWVRPNTSHNTTRNGTSYSTAWGGWSEIVWGTSGVKGGDTLAVCGQWTGLTSILSIGTHGATNEATRVFIVGNYKADDPAVMTFSGANYLQNQRAWTDISGFEITAGTSNCMFILSSATNCNYRNNKLHGVNNPHISLYAANGQAHTDVLFEGNTFDGKSYDNVNGLGALNWFVSGSGAISSLTRVTVKNNLFKDLITGRAAIHFRIDFNFASASSTMTDIIVQGNTFLRVQGLQVELNGGFDTFGQCTGAIIKSNISRDCTPTPLGGNGGMLSLKGFTDSPALGRPIVEFNKAYNVTGAAGLCNTFYGNWVVRYNEADGLYTNNIDGNGILFDHGNNGAVAYDNKLNNIPGLPGVDNSGCGIMVLDSSNVELWNNYGTNMKHGIYIGSNLPSGQSAKIHHNTFLGITNTGIRILGSASIGAIVVQNNILTAASGNTQAAVHNSNSAWAGETYNDIYGFGASIGHTFGTGTISVDPKLTSAYLPVDGSAVIGTGLHTTYMTDADGKSFNNPPTTGAYEKMGVRLTRV